ncbi:MAG TPA: hypothetical protein VHV51_04505, partial [Polyangiaceae bacterium]|nr:hypothetical protein [Polyangiaceae bacterium]
IDSLDHAITLIGNRGLESVLVDLLDDLTMFESKLDNTSAVTELGALLVVLVTEWLRRFKTSASVCHQRRQTKPRAGQARVRCTLDGAQRIGARNARLRCARARAKCCVAAYARA